MRKLLLLFLGFIALCILSIMVFNASTQISLQSRMGKATPTTLAIAKYFKTLEKGLAMATFQDNTGKISSQNRPNFKNFLAQQFPKLHAAEQFKVTTFNENNLAFKWQGTQSNSPYIVFIAPYQVQNFADTVQKVQVQNDTLYANGALQSKTALIALLAAMEDFLGKGIRFKRNILILAPCENDAFQYADLRNMAAEMKYFDLQYAHILYAASGNHSDYFLDLDQPSALVGISDKQILNLTLMSQTPEAITSVLNQIKEYNLPIDLNAPANKAFIEYLAPEAGFTKSIYLSNTWIVDFLAKALIKSENRLQFANELNITAWQESIREGKNAITLNLQLPAHWNSTAFLKNLEEKLLKKLQITYTLDYHLPANTPNNIANKSFELLQTTIKQTFGNYVVLPANMDKATGAAYWQYQTQTPVLYYAPFHFTKDNYLKAYHGYEEYISKIDFENMIQFYIQYLKNCNI